SATAACIVPASTMASAIATAARTTPTATAAAMWFGMGVRSHRPACDQCQHHSGRHMFQLVHLPFLHV
ncbi:hypothetical protein, partial [Komagataeibacter saccharivorans]|uniref:hypothetical protein n=2 Tax=Komagataeibacter saccharivorans TaxID=265959 RepID=UPI0039EC241E